jgi:ribonuclease VapC
MVLDSSAVVALLLKEPGYERLLDCMTEATVLGIGTPTLAETGIVLASRLGNRAFGMLGRFLAHFEVVEIPFEASHWQTAVEAWLRFGKGRHAASLNFGDCLAYAVARAAGQPLLFTGNDFRKTDVEPALR